jgi:O-antigen/teichoic acid export membrane protein
VLVLGSLIAALLYMASPAIGHLFGNARLTPMLKAASVLIWLQALSNISMSMLRRNLDMRRYQLIQQGTYVGGFGVVSLCLALYGAGAWSLLGGYAAQVISCLTLGYAATRHTLKPRFHGEPTFIRFGLQVAATNMVNWIVENVDRLLVGRIWGVTPLGLYTVSLNLTRAPVSMVASAVQSVAFAATSRGQDNTDGAGVAYRLMVILLSCLLLPGFMIIAFHSEWIISMVYGESWMDAAPYLRAFAVASPFIALAAVTGSMLWGLGGVGGELRVQLVVATALVALFCLAADLSVAVWIIPTVYLLRFALLSVTFCKATAMRASQGLRCILPSVFIGGIALLTAAGTHVVLDSWPAKTKELVSLALSLLSITAATRVLFPRMLDSNVKTLIEALSRHSKMIRVVSKIAGLRLQENKSYDEKDTHSN